MEAARGWVADFGACPSKAKWEIIMCFNEAATPTAVTANFTTPAPIEPTNTSTSAETVTDTTPPTNDTTPDTKHKESVFPWRPVLIWGGVGVGVLVAVGIAGFIVYVNREKISTWYRSVRAAPSVET